jgi:hypothetical protein
MKMKAFISVVLCSGLLSSNALAENFCGDNWNACPYPPNFGTCGSYLDPNCQEERATIQPTGTSGAWKFGELCITVDGGKRVKNVGWGLYPNDAHGDYWMWFRNKFTDTTDSNGNRTFCITGGNQSHNVLRPMFIRVWFE